MNLRFSNPDVLIRNVALARTPLELRTGFANRRDIGYEEAILFELPETGLTPFSMAETYVPLDLLFLDESGQVVGMVTASALSRTPYAARVPYRYVLETAAGRLAALGIGLQSRLLLLG